jgi:general secretion pathway protein G
MTRTTRSTVSRSRRGFTLVEVLLVLAILGVIMSLVVPRVMGRQEHALADATKLSINGVEQALRMYALDHGGRYPSGSEGLDVLTTPPKRDDSRWRGPYLEHRAKDAWGSEFVYVSPGRRNPRGFDIVSPGPDLQPDTDDDIGNWEPESTGR